MSCNPRPRRRLLRTTAGLGLSLATVAGAADDEDGERVRALEERVADLEHRLSLRREAPAEDGADDSLLEHLGNQLRSLQIHGAISQGFAWSDRNDYLSMKTSRGSFAWTEATLNVTKQLSDKLHAGLQIYTHQLGEFGEFDFLLDYAYLDYRWRDWLGFRIGRNKTPVGLYSDTIDFEFLHPWALPPFAVYDTSRRSTIAHDGLDIYGDVDLGGLGSLSYTLAGGGASIPDNGGNAMELSSNGLEYRDSQVDYICGFDLSFRPAGVLEGLAVGCSHYWFEFDGFTAGLLDQGMRSPGSGLPPLLPMEIEVDMNAPGRLINPYLEYQRGNWLVAAEYKSIYHQNDTFTTFPATPQIVEHRCHESRGWYVLAAYRFAGHHLGDHELDWLQLGAAYSSFYRNFKDPHDLAANYSRDLTGTVRLDLGDHWHLKLEVHHLHGGATFPLPDDHRYSPTTLLAVKAGVSF